MMSDGQGQTAPATEAPPPRLAQVQKNAIIGEEEEEGEKGERWLGKTILMELCTAISRFVEQI